MIDIAIAINSEIILSKRMTDFPRTVCYKILLSVPAERFIRNKEIEEFIKERYCCENFQNVDFYWNKAYMDRICENAQLIPTHRHIANNGMMGAVDAEHSKLKEEGGIRLVGKRGEWRKL